MAEISLEKFNDQRLREAIAFDLVGGNPDLAKAVLDPASQTITAVKMRFSEVNMGIYGLAILFYARADKKVLSILAVINRNKNTVIPPTFPGWKEFHMRIEQERFYAFDGKMVSDFMASMKEKISFELRDPFLTYLASPSEKRAKRLFEDLLYYALGTQNYRVDVELETLNIVDYHIAEYSEVMRLAKARLEMEDAEREAPAEVNAAPAETTITVTPVVSPINGKVIYDVEEGETIFVRIADESGRGRAYLEKMQARHKTESPKIPAVVRKAERLNEKEYSVRVTLEDDLVGVIIETDPVKVMVVGEETNAAAGQKKSGASNKSAKKVSTAIVFAAAGFVILALVVAVVVMIVSAA